MKGGLVTFCLLFSSLFSFGQWSDVSFDKFIDVVKRSDEFVSLEESYAVRGKYVFYEYDTSKVATQEFQYSIVYDHNKKLLNIQELGQNIIQNNSVRLIINDEEKEIIVNQIDSTYLRRNRAEEFEKLTKSPCKIRMRDEAGESIYEIEFAATSTYDRATIHFDKKGAMRKYILHYGKAVPNGSWTEEKIIKPKLEIILDDYQQFNNSSEVILETPETYFKNFDSLQLKDGFEGYEIIDLRTKS